MNEVVASDVPQMSLEEAQQITNQIIDKVADIRELLVRMELEAGWVSMGYDSWEAYLVELGKATKAGSKYLRRVGNAGLLEAGTGHDIGTFKEGVVRPINETLSDAKGFTYENRAVALELAIEIAGGEAEVTGPIAQQAAWHVAVVEKTPDAGSKLVLRMQHGFTSPKVANTICQIMRSTRASGIEHILAEVTDIELAMTMANLNSTNGEGWQDVVETIERTNGYMPTDNGQVLLSEATNSQLINHLNEPARLQRHAEIVGESELYRQVAVAAAGLMVEYYGPSESNIPEVLSLDKDMFKRERKLYRLCQQAGLIRGDIKS
jgi:hypothetical protein